MASIIRSKQYTFEDFCFLVREDQKADLIDGVIYMASPDNTDANALFVWLLSLIHLFVSRKDLGAVFGSRVAFRLDDTNGPEPDIAFVGKNRKHDIKRGRVEGPPDLAVEIVSPDSVERDYEKKFKLYQDAGVQEYWILDEIQETVQLFRHNRQGKFREVRPKQGAYYSQVLPGFWLRPEWLWHEPRPDLLAILQQYLG